MAAGIVVSTLSKTVNWYDAHLLCIEDRLRQTLVRLLDVGVVHLLGLGIFLLLGGELKRLSKPLVGVLRKRVFKTGLVRTDVLLCTALRVVDGRLLAGVQRSCLRMRVVPTGLVLALQNRHTRRLIGGHHHLVLLLPRLLGRNNVVLRRDPCLLVGTLCRVSARLHLVAKNLLLLGLVLALRLLLVELGVALGLHRFGL